MQALFEEFLQALFEALFKEGLPFLEHLAKEPNTLIDAAPDPELSDALNAAINDAIASGAAPAAQ